MACRYAYPSVRRVGLQRLHNPQILFSRSFITSPMQPFLCPNANAAHRHVPSPTSLRTYAPPRRRRHSSPCLLDMGKGTANIRICHPTQTGNAVCAITLCGKCASETGERNFAPASPSDTRAHVQRGTSIQKATALLLSEWAVAVLGYPDSNQKKQDQNLLCCQLHHTPNFQVFASAPLLFASAKVAPSCNSARLPPFFLRKPLKKLPSYWFPGRKNNALHTLSSHTEARTAALIQVAKHIDSQHIFDRI